MITLARFALGVILFCPVIFSAQAAFSSFYVFGDGVSTTTQNTNGPAIYYYGLRYCNGRVWPEVLSQWQGLAYDSNKNISYFGHYSSNLIASVNNFAAPPDTTNALFAVWVCNADFVDYMYGIGDPGNASHGTNLTAWNNAINQTLTNHWKALTNLYAKGARTLILPNAVDITKTYAFPGLPPANQTFVRQRIISFNTTFTTTWVNQLKATCPSLTIYVPDIFQLLDNLVASPASYGLVNPGNDAVDDPALADKSLNGPGANYVFWDYIHPSAKVQMMIADTIYRPISVPKITNITALTTSNRLDLANVPVGRNGLVESSTNFANWTTAQSITSTNTTQPAFVPISGPLQFYRLRFPFVWTWP